MPTYQPRKGMLRLAPRSETSSNWRTKTEIEANDSNISNHHSTSPAYGALATESSGSNSNGASEISNGPRPDKVVRGEEDTRTSEAIAEGRRLYVGNMPYLAKIQDVNHLLEDPGCDL